LQVTATGEGGFETDTVVYNSFSSPVMQLNVANKDSSGVSPEKTKSLTNTHY